MTRLTERIQISAGRRLPAAAGRLPAERLDCYRDFLRYETDRLRQAHRGGATGGEICRGRGLVLDLLLQHLLELLMQELPPLTAGVAPRFALVATGGYGRGELNPFSDVDILFLHNLEGAVLARGRVHPWLAALTEGLLYTLWDLGLKVGHAVRSVEDCVQVANRDMQSKTALLEARFIVGDRELFGRLESVFLASCVRGQADAYLMARIEDQASRRAKHGDSATMLEPNIKNGCGGLRDYQNLLWMSYFKYRTRSLAELESRGLIGAEERGQLEQAYDFLLRVRSELHYEANRAADVLGRALQPRLAYNLGYTERSPVRRIEAFMGDLYLHMRHLYLITRTLERRLALLPDPRQRLPGLRQLMRRGRRRMRRQVLDGFDLADGEIRALNPGVFAEEPRRLLRVVFYAQQRGLDLHPELAQLARQQLHLVDATYRNDAGAAETFLGILDRRGAVAPAIRALHETGVLGRYLPEFGALTCLVQHEFYHQYTADEHTLHCLEHLDQVWEAKTAPYRAYAEIFQEIDRPFLLYLALLLHDSGKARRDGDHAVTGARLAARAAQRSGLDAATTRTLCWLIEHHLLMAQISQRRDLDDPAVIRSFADQVQSLETLRMLTLHTLADSLGTGPSLWNGFKDSLLRRLYHKTCEHLTDSGASLQAEEQRHEQLMDEVRAEVIDELEEDEIASHFALMPARYLGFRQRPAIVADLRLVHRFLLRLVHPEADPLVPVLDWEDDPDRGCTRFKVCTWDRPGLFAKIAGSLAAAGLNILGARIFTRQDDIILDSFAVADARTGHLAEAAERDRCERLLSAILTGEKVDLAELIARRPALPPLYRSVEGERLVTTVHFDNLTSETCTVLDLETEDHLGLLYHVADELSRLWINIALARVSTERGAAVDTFYVADAAGRKITAPERQEEIRDCLLRRIATLATAAVS